MKEMVTTDDRKKHERRTLARNMLFSTVGSVSYQGCLWLTTVLVVTLSNNYQNSGILAVAMATGNMFFAIASFNMRTFQVSDTKGQYKQADYVGFRLVTTALAWVLLLPYILFTSGFGATAIAAVLFLLFKTDESLVDALYGVDQHSQRIDFIGISQFSRGLIVLAAFAGVLALTKNLSWAIFGMFAGAMTVTLFYDIRRASSLNQIIPRFRPGVVRTLFITCLPIAAAPLLANMVVSVSRQLFASLYGTEMLGRYAAIATPAVLIQAAARYLYLPLLVPMAKVWETRDKKRFLRSVWNTLVAMLLISFIAIVILNLLGRHLLPLVFGESIIEYLYLFPYVLCSTAVIAIFWFLTDALIICRDIKGQFIASLLAFLIAALIMYPLEKLFYMNGINIVVIVATGIGAVIALYRLQHV